MDGTVDGLVLRLRVLLIGWQREGEGRGTGTARRRSLAAPVLSPPRSRLLPRLFIWRRLIVNDDSPKCSDRKLLITGVVCHLHCVCLCACVRALTWSRRWGRLRERADSGQILSKCPWRHHWSILLVLPVLAGGPRRSELKGVFTQKQIRTFVTITSIDFHSLSVSTEPVVTV